VEKMRLLRRMPPFRKMLRFLGLAAAVKSVRCRRQYVWRRW
jgi:hypothetical protein